MQESRLKQRYISEGVKSLTESFAYSSVMQVPKLEKIVVNCTSKDVVANSKSIDSIYDDIFVITGQKPVITKARKSIASFKLREGMPLGVAVTLRGNMMYHFLDRLINIALPNSKDFKGFTKKQLDGKGNFSMGVKEQIIFPEIDYDRVEKIRGFNINIITTAKNNEEGKALLEFFGLPFVD